MSAALKENHVAPSDTAFGQAPKQSSITRYPLSLIPHVGYAQGISSSMSDPDRKPHNLADSKNRHQSGRANLDQAVVSSLNEDIGSDIGSDLPLKTQDFRTPPYLANRWKKRLEPPKSVYHLGHCGGSGCFRKFGKNIVQSSVTSASSFGFGWVIPSHFLWRRLRSCVMG